MATHPPGVRLSLDVLSQITIGDGASLPGGVTPAELRDYLRGLIDRLVQLGHP